MIEMEIDSNLGGTYNKGDVMECGCLVLDIQENSARLQLCPEHKKQLSVALKQSIISKSKD